MEKSSKAEEGKMTKVKWGIIGVGDVTEVKSGPAFNKVENSEIVMVMRRNLNKAKDYAKRHGISAYTNNAEEILNNPEINAIYISTPPSSHAEYTIAAANAKKHVYVEKPMAVSFDQCQKMNEACKQNGVKLFVAYYRRELDYFKKVKELIDYGEIGDVKLVDIKFLTAPKKDDYNPENLPWRVNPKIAGAGYFYDLASHQFDFLDYLIGPIKSAKGNAANQLNLYSVEDTVTASFSTENNILGVGSWAFTLENMKEIDCTEIIGSKGKITFSFFNETPIRVHKRKTIEEINIPYPKHVQQQLINSVVNDILGYKQCVSTGSSALRTNRVLENILH